jgi:TetR/AcrR family transcriptional regulator, cholesterol catabolism regulator
MSSPPLRPALRERYDRRQQEVVDLAAGVFAQRGYHATSIDDLIEATGLTRGGLYHYIGSKQELLFRIHEELLEPLLDRSREILGADADPETHLRALVGEWVAHVERHRDHMLVFDQERRMVEEEPRWAEVRRARKEFEDLLAGVLERGRRDGLFAIADPQLTLLALLGMVNYLPQWYDPAGRLDAASIATGYCDALLDGIRVRPAG